MYDESKCYYIELLYRPLRGKVFGLGLFAFQSNNRMAAGLRLPRSSHGFLCKNFKQAVGPGVPALVL